jgi:hypothetical protein
MLFPFKKTYYFTLNLSSFACAQVIMILSLEKDDNMVLLSDQFATMKPHSNDRQLT